MFPGYKSKFLETDPEFIERFDNFAFDEVVNSDDLHDRTRMMATPCYSDRKPECGRVQSDGAGCTQLWRDACRGKRDRLSGSRISGNRKKYPPVWHIVNDILTERGIKLPLDPQATTTTENRLKAGEQTMIDIMGESMRGFAESGPEESRHVDKRLTDNCFGDYYTRKGLDYKQREMITFCFLAAQGGCEPQLTSHAMNNMMVGNDKAFLIKVVSQCLPFIGYPRSLNTLNCVNAAADKMKEAETKPENPGAFPMGDKLPEAFSKYFVGQAYLQTLTDKGGPISNVTFEPGCRNNWHIHHKGGQILLVTGGKGWYQAWGEPAQELHPGDVVDIPAEVKHWHGAAADSWFSHLAVEIPAEGGFAEWLEAVSDEEYSKLGK